MTDEVDDSCASIFQLLGSPKKKKKSGKLNRVMNEQSVNSSLHPSFSTEPSSVFPLHIDSQRTEDNLTQQQESRRGEKDTRNDLCAGSFQFSGSPKKKKKKVKLEKLNGEKSEQSVNSFSNPSFSSDTSSVFPLHVDSQETEDNQTEQQKPRREEKDTGDDSCAGSFQLLSAPKKKRKKKNKLEKKLNGETNEQSVNSFFNPSFSSDTSSVFPLHVDNQETEDNQTEQQKPGREEKDTGDDSCAGSFQLLSAPKKKRKKKNKLNGETNEQSVNPFFNPSFSSDPSFVFPLHVDNQETEDNQTQQQESRRGEKDTRNDLCAGSFQFICSPKKKKKKVKLEKLNGEKSEPLVNPFSNLYFSAHPSFVFPLHVDSQETEDNQTEQQKPRREEKDTGDDSCAGSFQLLSAPKKKRKKKNKLEKKLNEQSVNSFFNPSFSSDTSSVFPFHVDSKETEDNQTEQQKPRREEKDTGDDSCAGSFQLLSAPKKKRKKKNKLNGETNEQSVNPFFNPSFSSDPSFVFPLHVDNQETEDNQTQQQESRRGGKDTLDDLCAGSFQFLGSPKKKKKKVKLEKLNGEKSEPLVNPFSSLSFSVDPSFVFPLHVDCHALHVDSKETEDNQTEQQKSRKGGKDTGDDSCAGSFQLLSSPKKKRKKNKLEKKLNGETNEQSVNSFFNPSFSSAPSSVFPLHVDNQEIEDNRTQQQKSRRGGKDTRETPDSQMENSWVVTESNLDDQVGTVSINEKRKRKHMSSEQDGGNEFYIPETQKYTSSLPEADHLEKVGGSCEISTKKNEEEEVTKVLEEQVEANEASVGRPDFASDLVKTQEYIFVSPSQTPLKTQDAVFLQNKMRQKLSIPDPSARLSSPTAQKKLCKHKKLHCVSSPTGNSDATKDGLLVKDTVEADGKHKSHQYHMLQHSHLSGHRDERGSSSKYLISEPDILDNEFLESPVFPVQDLETVTQELEEFIPHVRTLSDPSIKQLSIRDLVRFKHFKKQGISVRFGRFSKKENELLRKNMEAFLEETGINSAEKLLFTERFPEELAYLKRLKCEHLFGLKIAQGIPRPWRLVYYRARKMFDPRNYNGKYSEKEKKMLMKYKAKYGNNWKKMSKLMDRSSHSLHLKYCEMKSKFNSGAWSREETKKLLNTLKEILRAKVEGLNSTLEPKNMDQAMLLREHLYKDIPWFWVEAKVGTRGWKQCKKKWLYIVTKKMSGGKMWNRGIANVIFKINVIERLYQVEDVDDINWEDISHTIGNVPPDYVRNRFYKMKSMYVPSQYRKTFPETIGYLHKEILPMLRSKVEGKTKRVATKNRTWKSVFQFNYIFQDENDLIDEEEEEEEGLVKGVATE